MASPSQPAQQSVQARVNETATIVRKLVKKKLTHDQAAAELAPIFGLGKELLGAQKAQCLFLHIKRTGAFAVFARRYIDGKWGLPVPEWTSVYDLVVENRLDREWTQRAYPDDDVLNTATVHDWRAEHHYAKFIIFVVAHVRGVPAESNLVPWLRDGDLDESFWTLYHALMYLHLETERGNMPLGARLVRRLSRRR